MIRTVFIFLTLFISSPIFSQLSEHEISYFTQCLTEKVNELRISKDLNALEPDKDLEQAATMHSKYMARVNRLSHKEASSKLRTPDKRVQKFSNEFELVGENILFIENTRKKYKDEQIEELALQMFTMWKESPGHYANMIHPQYKLSGFGFAKSKSGKLYATQVFGTKGIVIENQLSKNAFGIKEKGQRCKEILNGKRNFVVNMGNAIHIRGNKVMLYYHSKRIFNEMLKDQSDGLAIDLVEKDQFTCDSENLLDFNAVYDGVLLKPVYKDELFNENQAQGDYRLVSQVGTVPEHLLGKELSPSLVYIKNGTGCDYIYPVNIPNDNYDLVPIEPKLLNPQQYPFLKKGIVGTRTLYFDFSRGKTSPDFQDFDSSFDGDPVKIDIVSYSSIEGDSVRNEALMKGRAEYIRSYLNKNKELASIKKSNKSEENWETMFFQLDLLGLDSLKCKSKDELRKFVVQDQMHNWDSLLYLQRRSFATIYYNGKLDSKDSLFYSQNFYSAIENKNMALANRALAEMYMQENVEVVFAPHVFDLFNQEPKLVQNAAAILAKSYLYNWDTSIRFLHHWLNQTEKLNQDALYNLSILYCKVTSEVLNSWDVSKSVFAKIVEPNKVKEIISQFVGKDENNKLLLNYHLTAIQYYGQNNYQSGLAESFLFIENYFEDRILEMSDEVKLCLFFNSWSRYDLTVSHLFKRINEREFNEEAAFVLAKTTMGYPYNLTDAEIKKVMQRAFRKNKQKWCYWIEDEFQLLRNKDVKLMYCQECNQ